MKKNQEAFFALVRAGLWENDARLLSFGDLNFSAIQTMAEEQSVVGLISAGLEHVTDTIIPKQVLLQFIGKTLKIEEQNMAMNNFLGNLVDGLRKFGIYTLLVKGQGVAQCYEKPLWRTSGDVDLFLNKDNYQKAKRFLIPIAAHVDPEDLNKLHQAITIDSWMVELHGTMNTLISHKINKTLSVVQKDVFQNGRVRVWNNNGVDIFLPAPDNDIIIVFTHFINHFYGEGVGLRQICDLCRLLWTYRDSIDSELLKKRLSDMGLMTEWNAFGLFAVEYLGMPEEAIPLCSRTQKMSKKTERICRLIIETGNFGHNKDESYRVKSSRWKSYLITFRRRLWAFTRLTTIFPNNAPRFFVTYVFGRIKAVI